MDEDTACLNYSEPFRSKHKGFIRLSVSTIIRHTTVSVGEALGNLAGNPITPCVKGKRRGGLPSASQRSLCPQCFSALANYVRNHEAIEKYAMVFRGRTWTTSYVTQKTSTSKRRMHGRTPTSPRRQAPPKEGFMAERRRHPEDKHIQKKDAWQNADVTQKTSTSKRRMHGRTPTSPRRQAPPKEGCMAERRRHPEDEHLQKKDAWQNADATQKTSTSKRRMHGRTPTSPRRRAPPKEGCMAERRRHPEDKHLQKKDAWQNADVTQKTSTSKRRMHGRTPTSPRRRAPPKEGCMAERRRHPEDEHLQKKDAWQNADVTQKTSTSKRRMHVRTPTSPRRQAPQKKDAWQNADVTQKTSTSKRRMHGRTPTSPRRQAPPKEGCMAERRRHPEDKHLQKKDAWQNSTKHTQKTSTSKRRMHGRTSTSPRRQAPPKEGFMAERRRHPEDKHLQKKNAWQNADVTQKTSTSKRRMHGRTPTSPRRQAPPKEGCMAERRRHPEDKHLQKKDAWQNADVTQKTSTSKRWMHGRTPTSPRRQAPPKEGCMSERRRHPEDKHLQKKDAWQNADVTQKKSTSKRRMHGRTPTSPRRQAPPKEGCMAERRRHPDDKHLQKKDAWQNADVTQKTSTSKRRMHGRTPTSPRRQAPPKEGFMAERRRHPEDKHLQKKDSWQNADVTQKTSTSKRRIHGRTPTSPRRQAPPKEGFMAERRRHPEDKHLQKKDSWQNADVTQKTSTSKRRIHGRTPTSPRRQAPPKEGFMAERRRHPEDKHLQKKDSWQNADVTQKTSTSKRRIHCITPTSPRRQAPPKEGFMAERRRHPEDKHLQKKDSWQNADVTQTDEGM